MVRLLILNDIKRFNKRVEERAQEKNGEVYVHRNVHENALKALDKLPDCAEEYYLETNNVIWTATYYLKNIIVLQAFEDGNHRTALNIAKCFLKSDGYNIKEINENCYKSFKGNLTRVWRQKEFWGFSSLDSKVLKFKQNVPGDHNYTFEYCLKFIKNKMLR